ncbi:lysophospholipase, putative [Plasmodium vinckei brucechwatti]|uniref:Lysophospholipase, putative n=1 Tax=Plasmodium vinckei brucechwatti TaxID=119398 RepID=A0A6V7RZ21_PLAVN|nr:lysophospholipase, putative [Plasmodium vinckei brucechwatti]
MEEIELNNDELRNTTCNLDGNPKVGWLCNKNGLLLKTYGWLVKNAVGIILLIHGLKSHTRLTFMRINIRFPNNGEELVVDNDNYYIYKDSWIENFNKNGYSVYALDLQGHGESETWKNVTGDFSSFDDLVDDVLQYMNKIQDEISNDNQTDGESYDIVPTKKKRLPMYIIGHSMGGTIGLRVLQLLNKEKEDKIDSGESNNYKKSSSMLGNPTNVNEIDNDMNSSKNDDPCTSSASTSAMTNAIASTSNKCKGRYSCLDKFNIKGCVTLSGMMIIKILWNIGLNSFKYFYLPLMNFLACIAPNKIISSEMRYKKSEYIDTICKYDKFRNNIGLKFRCVSELIKGTLALDNNINYMPKDIPLLFVHSKDDTVCCFKGAYSFYNNVDVPEKEFHTVTDMYHAITVEPGNEEILKKIIDWISNVRSNDENEIEDG